MSNNKRDKVRETFGNIIAGSSRRASASPAPPAPPKKRRRIQETIESRSEVSLSDIKATLERILSQNSELNTKVNEILNRVARIERDRVIDQNFINVLNLFN